MAVELNIEFEKEPVLDLTMGVLQFIGISDHNQLSNRDMTGQHPIGAIEGLGGKLKHYDEAFEEETKKFKSYDEAFETVNDNFKAVEETFKLQEELNKEFEYFKNNIATPETVEEVLKNG